MKILTYLLSLLSRRSMPVSSVKIPTSIPGNFEDYLADRAKLTLNFFSPNSTYDLRHDHIYDGASFGTRDTGRGEETYSVYVLEYFTLLKEKGRNFLISTIGILNPENDIKDIREITKHPPDKKDINGFLILITEITDIEKLIRTTRGITYSLDKLRSGATDLISARKFHDKVVNEVISAASLHLDIDDVFEQLTFIKIKRKCL